MAWIVLAALVALPVIEIALFIKSAQWIGLLSTVLLAIASAMIGLALIRQKGLELALQARAQLNRGEMPVRQTFDAICLALAGGLMLLPGFFTDMLALLLLLPPVRALLQGWLASRVVVHSRNPGGTAPQSPQVIDAEYSVVDKDGPDLPPHGR